MRGLYTLDGRAGKAKRILVLLVREEREVVVIDQVLDAVQRPDKVVEFEVVLLPSRRDLATGVTATPSPFAASA